MSVWLFASRQPTTATFRKKKRRQLPSELFKLCCYSLSTESRAWLISDKRNNGLLANFFGGRQCVHHRMAFPFCFMCLLRSLICRFFYDGQSIIIDFRDLHIYLYIAHGRRGHYYLLCVAVRTINCAG